MRGLWRTIAYMAEDLNSFDSHLAAIAGNTTNLNLKNNIELSTPPANPQVLNLQKQPTQQILDAIDSFLRGVDPTLVLCAYELAEVNRITYETSNEVPPHKNLKDYWAGLGAVGPANRADPNFMEAVGALAIDGWTRSGFALNNVSLTKWFQVTPAQEGALRSKVVANSPSDLAAAVYSAKSWPASCASIVAMSDDWTHLNV